VLGFYRSDNFAGLGRWRHADGIPASYGPIGVMGVKEAG
jgi:hypothetical protein